MAQSPYLDQNAPEILALERQKKLADLLQSRALEQPQGQMVSGRYVAPSILQQLAPLANAYMGRKAGEDVESKQAKLANLIRGQNVTETKDILETMYGKQGQEVPMVAPSTDADAQPSGFYGNKPSVEMQGGVAPDKMSALLKSLNAQSTGGQSLAPTILAQLNAKPVFHSVAPGASLLQETPTGVKPVFTAPKETEQPSEIKLALALDRSLPRDPNTWTQKDADQAKDAVITYMREKRPVTNVTTNVSTGKAYGQEFGNLMAKQDIDKYTIAQNAPKILQQSAQIKDLVDKGALTGSGADFMLNTAKVFNVVGGSDSEKIKKTELLVSSLGQNVLDNIKTSGLGAGQGFTEKDKVFLEKVVGGQITLDKKTIVELANLQEKAAKASIDKWNDRVKTMPQEVLQTTGIGPITIPKNINPNNVYETADEIINRRKKP